MSPRKIAIIAISSIALMVVTLLSSRLIETNKAGYYQVKQAFYSGDMTVRMRPGVYGQWLGDIHTYRAVATVGFGTEKGEGSADIGPAEVIFSDGAEAKIDGKVRVALPTTKEGMKKIKAEYVKGYDHFIRDCVVPTIENAVKLSANLRTAQDAYTTLAVFQQSIKDQLMNGTYVTKAVKKVFLLATGEEEERWVTVIVNGEDGKPLRVPNMLMELGCAIRECVISVPVFDAKVKDAITQRKQAAIDTEVAKQNAIKAKQDAITAAEQGKADVATAQYKEEVVKIKAVTEAKKNFEVEALNAKKALETAKRIKAEGMAKAAANQALVAAGLTPLEKAMIAKDTAIGVAAEMAKLQFPTTMILSGGAGSKGGTIDPFTAIGLNSFLEISDKIASKKTK